MGGIFPLDIRLLFEDIILKSGFLDCIAEKARLAFGIESNIFLCGFAKSECSREITCTVFVEALPASLIDLIASRVG